MPINIAARKPSNTRRCSRNAALPEARVLKQLEQTPAQPRGRRNLRHPGPRKSEPACEREPAFPQHQERQNCDDAAPEILAGDKGHYLGAG